MPSAAEQPLQLGEAIEQILAYPIGLLGSQWADSVVFGEWAIPAA